MIKAVSNVISLGALLLVATPAMAQYTGPGGEERKQSIELLVQKADEKASVMFRGNIVRKTDSELYDFSDGTGTITVRIPDDYFPQKRINQHTQVVIFGTVRGRRTQARYVDVHDVRLHRPNAKVWRVPRRGRLRVP